MPIMQCLLVAYVYIIFTQMYQNYHIVVLNKVANKNRENTNISLSKRQ